VSAVLVAGGAGYIGSHMAQALADAGREVVVLDNLATGHREFVPPGARFVEADLGDEAALDALFAARRIDAVMHFAACSLVGESVVDPLKYWDNNAARSATLLRAMLRHGVRRLVFSSTAAVYGEPERTPIREDAPVLPTNPYGASKAAVERMLADCERAHGLRYAALRYFNAAGADPAARRGERHEPETHLIPLVLRVASGRRPDIAVYGSDYPTPDGTCLRDYIHICDLASAHLLALDALAQGARSMTLNLGNERGYSVREVIETARAVTGHPIPVVERDRRPGDPAVLVADSGRARRELGWRPAFPDLERIVATAWHWEQREAARAAPAAACPS
jgi:UDP-glucose 4-epimerase